VTTCTLCNADLPQGVRMNRRTITLGQSKMLDAPLCRRCTDNHDKPRKWPNNIAIFVIGLLVFSGLALCARP
jgi:hypothetical protein